MHFSRRRGAKRRRNRKRAKPACGVAGKLLENLVFVNRVSLVEAGDSGSVGIGHVSPLVGSSCLAVIVGAEAVVWFA